MYLGRAVTSATNSVHDPPGWWHECSILWSERQRLSINDEGSKGKGAGSSCPPKGSREGILRAAATLRTVDPFQAQLLCGSAPPAQQ